MSPSEGNLIAEAALIAAIARRICSCFVRDVKRIIKTDIQYLMPSILNLYTDGSFDVASRSGCWAFVIMAGDRGFHTVSGTMSGPSNNTFEVASVVQALSWLEREAPTTAAVIWTDSVYVVDGCDRWRHIWRGNGWKKVKANPHERRRSIPDANLWQELDGLLQRNPFVRIQMCKGHSGLAGNEMADSAARAALADAKVEAR